MENVKSLASLCVALINFDHLITQRAEMKKENELCLGLGHENRNPDDKDEEDEHENINDSAEEDEEDDEDDDGKVKDEGRDRY